MKIYVYDAFTSEYLGERDARLDPLETTEQGKDCFLIPQFATMVIPPKKLKKNEQVVFDGNAWRVVNDFRGTIFYNTDGNELVILKLEELVPEGYTTTKPPKKFLVPHWDGSKWVDNYIAPDPDEELIPITRKVLELLKAAKTPTEFVAVFKAQVGK